MNPLFSLAYIFSELTPRYQQFHFLAAGETLEKLKRAQAGYDQQKALRQETALHLGATSVSLANNTVLFLGWPEFQSAAGFQVSFEKGTIPEGWYRPKEWGDRQTHFNEWVCLPKIGSGQQVYLFEQAGKLKKIYNDYGRPDHLDSYLSVKGKSLKNAYKKAGCPDDHQDYVGGWYSWEHDVFPKEKVSLYSKHIVDDVYVIVVTDVISKAAPDYIPEGCLSISAGESKMLEGNPGKAKARADNIRQEKSFYNIGARWLDKLSR